MATSEERSPESDPPTEVVAAAERLLAAAPSERAALLAELTQRHPAHATTLERMAADLFGLDRLLDAGFGAKTTTEPAAEPASIGGRRVLKKLGEGAFGAVYLCAQTTPVHRDVAIKVLRPGAGDRNTLARFDAERQFLARQNHPSITQVFDAGSLPDGRPFFVMEYVAGLPITRYCDERRLTIRERLQLFERLCLGVQHAHASGIVHRDLKPANILVVEVDGQPLPKIIDFGIAKALEATADIAKDGSMNATETGRVIGTPGYMSPEQALGHRRDIDARSDVFTLGVILYELLTGELPWGHRPTTTEPDPPLPSRRVATTTQRTTTLAHLRGAEPRQLASHLRGDLDWIVVKALQRDRDHRYASAIELVADLQRHIGHRPVLAGPPSLAYRLRKVLQRHRGAVLVAVGAVVVAAVGWVVLAQYESRARASADDANAAVANLLARANDPNIISAANSAQLRQVLMQDALSFYDRFLTERPTDAKHREGRARTLTSLSQVHWVLGQYPRAVATARDAVADAEVLVTSSNDNAKMLGVLGAARRNLGRALFSAGDVPAARAELERATDVLERCEAALPGLNRGLLASALLELSSTLNPTTEGKAVARTIDRARELQEAEVRAKPDSVAARKNLVSAEFALLRVQIGNGDAAGATATLQRMEEQLAHIPDPDLRLVSRVHLAGSEVAEGTGNPSEAVARLEKAAIAVRTLCDTDPLQAENWSDLANVHERLAMHMYTTGRLDEGDDHQRRAIDVTAKQVERFPDDPAAKSSLAARASFFAMALATHGQRSRMSEAENAAERADALLAALPPNVAPRDHEFMRWITLYRLAIARRAMGKPDTANLAATLESRMNACFERQGADPASASSYVEAAVWLADRHREAGRADAALPLLDMVDTLLDEFPSLDRREERAAEALLVRAQLAARRGDHAAAASFAEQAAESGAGWRSDLAASDGMRAAAEAAGADAALAGRYHDRARTFDAAVVRELEKRVSVAPDDPWVVVPLAQARLRVALALAGSDRAAAVALAAPALATLEAARSETFVNAWDENLVVRARALTTSPR